ncbi:Myc-associated zinc finger [Mycena chlorophos]|uniref:Myc-associated zinc finger n=1 Tax=Mycena chlorophos TaxID=658473 RepID=A0A8H6TK86_MYCCL|nr:Myc-associated zinc finger [Mycena chlorophos]
MISAVAFALPPQPLMTLQNTIRHDAPYTSTIRHEEAVDGRIYCPTCPGPRKYFATHASLEDHYRSKPDHPNCPRCGKGFATSLVRDEHFRSIHVKEKCPGCGKEIFQEDMAAHCLNSPEHSACSKCTIGFKTEADFTEHCQTVHPERFDERCTRFFHSDEEQEEHYKISVNHPTCEECGKGLVDNVAHEEHLRVVHPHHRYRSMPLPKPQGNGTWPLPVYGLQAKPSYGELAPECSSRLQRRRKHQLESDAHAMANGRADDA